MDYSNFQQKQSWNVKCRWVSEWVSIEIWIATAIAWSSFFIYFYLFIDWFLSKKQRKGSSLSLSLSLTFFLCTTWKLSLSKSSKVLHHHHLQSPSFTQREILCVRPVFGLWIPFLFYNSKYLFLVFDIFHSSLSLIYFLLLLIYYFLVY